MGFKFPRGQWVKILVLIDLKWMTLCFYILLSSPEILHSLSSINDFVSLRYIVDGYLVSNGHIFRISRYPRWTEVRWSVYICSALQVRCAYQVRWLLNWLYAFVQAEVRWSVGAIIQMRKKCAGSALGVRSFAYLKCTGVRSLAYLKCVGVCCSALGVRSLAYLECVGSTLQCAGSAFISIPGVR